MVAIRKLLVVGTAAWDQLCDDGVLDRTEWTDDQKWTAIGMMWNLTPGQIAVIRMVQVRPRKKGAVSVASTRRMMATVEKKGEFLLEAMSAERRRQFHLHRGSTGQAAGGVR